MYFFLINYICKILSIIFRRNVQKNCKVKQIICNIILFRAFGNLSRIEKKLIERKDLVIQKADKVNTVVVTGGTKYLEGIKSLLSDSSKFMELPIDEGKWINYIVNLESKLKGRLKVLKNEQKLLEKEFDSVCPVGTTPGILYGNLKVHKTVVNNAPKFDLFYQQ